MSLQDQIRTCAHAGCPCPADPESDYCSPSCEIAQYTPSAKCECYHDLCEQKRRTARIGSERKS